MPTEQNDFSSLAENRDVSEVNQLKSAPPQSELSFGGKLVGLSFNPSNDDKVSRVKRMFANIADELHEDHKGESATDLYDQLYHHAIGEILNAQMNVVKVLTLKY